MKVAHFRFYAELNDFLPPSRRFVAFRESFEVRGSVKDMIESLGVPHTEVDLILANGESVDFSYLVQEGDRISVYPVFESIDITPVLRVRPRPLRQTRFVLDIHLGRLANYLRMLGFDALYRNDYRDEELARLSCDQERILLTRDRNLLKRRAVQHGYCLRETRPRRQLLEVLERFDLSGSMGAFTRCLRCNGLLEAVSKEVVADRLPPQTREHYQEFHQCASCGQVYWKGSHYQRMQQFIESLG
jgi:hypothetical protein